MEKVYPELKVKSKGVDTPVEKQSKTPLDYVPNIVDAFKGIKKRVQLLLKDIGTKEAYRKENVQDEDGEKTRHHTEARLCMQSSRDAEFWHNSYKQRRYLTSFNPREN